MILSIYNGVTQARILQPTPAQPRNFSWFGIGGIQPAVPVRRPPGRRLRSKGGMGDVNTDAQARLTTAGFTGAHCKFVPFSGPFGGGTNVCDVGDDESGYQYGSELINRQGGTDIMRTEISNAGALMAERAKEQEVIIANARRLQQEATAAQMNTVTAAIPSGYTGPQQPVMSAHLPAPIPLVINSSGVVSHGDGGVVTTPSALIPMSSSGGRVNTSATATATGATIGASNRVPAFVTDAMNKVQDVTGELSMPVKLGLGVVTAFMLYKAVKH